MQRRFGNIEIGAGQRTGECEHIVLARELTGSSLAVILQPLAGLGNARYHQVGALLMKTGFFRRMVSVSLGPRYITDPRNDDRSCRVIVFRLEILSGIEYLSHSL